MFTIKCPKCAAGFRCRAAGEGAEACPSCGTRLKVFAPLIPALLSALGVPIFAFGRYMMVDVVGGLLESPLGIRVEREQLQFIMTAGKYAAWACSAASIGLALFSVMLRLVRGSYLLARQDPTHREAEPQLDLESRDSKPERHE